MNAIFARIIADKDAFFKHQQKDEEEMTNQDKMELLEALAADKLAIFLTRYEKYVKPVDCDCFAGNEDLMVQTIVKQIRGKKEASKKEKKNNRFLAMQKLLNDGVFFSDSKMREREPYLFDAMIGRFLENDRPTVSRDLSECTWSTLLDRLEDSSEIAERRNLQEMEWEGPRKNDGGRDHINRFMSHVARQTDDFVPEEEDGEGGDQNEDEHDDDEIEKMRREMERLAKIEADQYQDLGDDDTPQLLRHEFEAFMKEKFLAGKDAEFYDYSLCDAAASDPIRERDEEERWFDDE